MILLNDFSRQWQDTRDDAIHAFVEVGASAWYILGQQVREFEQELARYWDRPYAVGVASGLDAIELALRALGCRPGDKVVTTPVSAFATTLAIVKIGAVPVFVDVDEFGLVDLDAVGALLRRDPLVRYLVPVHLYGHALNLDKLASLRQEFGVAIVEDCAQSIGARWNGRKTGTVGSLAATSFYPTKNLGAFGDGGAVLAENEELARSIQVLRDYGQQSKYAHDVIGFNSRLDEVQAALLRRVGLPRLNRWTEQRRRIAAAYLSRIVNRSVTMPGSPVGSDSVWHLFPVLVAPERKSSFLAYLRSKGVSAAEHYPTPIPHQKAMQSTGHEIGPGGCDRAQLFCRSEVSLPIHPYMTDEEVSTVIASVNDWVV